MQRSGLLSSGLLLFTEILICVSLASLPLENSINCVFCGCRANLLRLKYVQTLWNSSFTEFTSSGRSGPDLSKVVSSAKRKSLRIADFITKSGRDYEFSYRADWTTFMIEWLRANPIKGELSWFDQAWLRRAGTFSSGSVSISESQSNDWYRGQRALWVSSAFRL